MKRCKSCNNILVQRKMEGSYDWNIRKYCNLECSKNGLRESRRERLRKIYTNSIVLEKMVKTKLKGRDRYGLYLQVQKLASKGFASVKIAEKLDISYPSCRNFARYFRDKNLLELLNQNKVKGQAQSGKKIKGRISYLKGKTYKQIFKSEEKAKDRSEITSRWMKTERNIRRFCKHPSKPQIELFNKIKKQYNKFIVFLEYPLKIFDNKIIWLDIAIPELKLNYELDGAYWHKDKRKDIIRDNLLKNLGWKIERIIYSK